MARRLLEEQCYCWGLGVYNWSPSAWPASSKGTWRLSCCSLFGNKSPFYLLLPYASLAVQVYPTTKDSEQGGSNGQGMAAITRLAVAAL